MNECYKTVSGESEEEYIIKKSRFIGYAKAVTSEKDAIDFISTIKREHWDATHNVYAFTLKDGDIKRYSDDGEPQGTAGMPVLNVLLKEELYNVAVVVTRYFGGVLLGGGGLVRAYSHSASLAVNAAGIITLVPWSLCKLCADYTYYSKLESLIRDSGGVVINSGFSDTVNIEFRIEKGAEDLFNKKLLDLTNGSVNLELFGETIAPKQN